MATYLYYFQRKTKKTLIMYKKTKVLYYTFLNFLRKRDALHSFQSHYFKCGSIYDVRFLTLKEYISKVPPQNWVFFGFSWMNTQEGEDFWHDISTDWREIAVKYILK